MADKDAGEPSLELPSLSLGRLRRKKAEPPPVPRDEAPATRPRDESAPTHEEGGSAPEVAPPAREVAPPAHEMAPPARGTPTPSRGRTTGATATAPLATDEVDHHPREEAGSRRRISLPALGGLAASLVTGALVGVLTVGLTWAGFGICELVQGTSSCGDPGFLLLLAIMIAMVVLGTALLRAWNVSDAGSISLLALGLMAVLALLFLVDVLFSWWMILVIPLLTMTTFALSHRVTTTVTEPTDR